MERPRNKNTDLLVDVYSGGQEEVTSRNERDQEEQRSLVKLTGRKRRDAVRVGSLGGAAGIFEEAGMIPLAVLKTADDTIRAAAQKTASAGGPNAGSDGGGYYVVPAAVRKLDTFGMKPLPMVVKLDKGSPAEAAGNDQESDVDPIESGYETRKLDKCSKAARANLKFGMRKKPILTTAHHENDARYYGVGAVVGVDDEDIFLGEDQYGSGNVLTNPIKGLEILNELTKLELKRIGEENEAEEIQELRDIAVLHGDSSGMKDKFLYKITYRPMDIIFPSGSRRGSSASDELSADNGSSAEDGMHYSLFYVTRKLRCVSTMSLGECTNGYRMRVLDRIGKGLLEVHRPSQYLPAFFRKLVPMGVEAEIFIINPSGSGISLNSVQPGTGHQPAKEIIGVVKREWGLLAATFTLHDKHGRIVATFLPTKRGSPSGYKIKIPGIENMRSGRLCTGADDSDLWARTVFAYPANMENKALLLGAAIFLAHSQKIGHFDTSNWATSLCSTLAMC